MDIHIGNERWDRYDLAYQELKDNPQIASDPEFATFAALVLLYQAPGAKPNVTDTTHQILERFLSLSTYRDANQRPDKALGRVIKPKKPPSQAVVVSPPSKPAAQRLQEIENLLPVLVKKQDLRIVGEVLNTLDRFFALNDSKQAELQEHRNTLNRIQAHLGDTKEKEFPQAEQKPFVALIYFAEQNFPSKSDQRRPFTELLKRWKVNQDQRALNSKDTKPVGTEEYLGRSDAAWRSLDFKIDNGVAEQLNQALRIILTLPLNHHPDALPDESLRFQRYFLAVEIARGAKPPHPQYIGDFAETVKVILDRLPQDHALFAPLKELFISWQAIDNRKPNDGGKKTKLDSAEDKHSEEQLSKKRVRGLAVVENPQFRGLVENWRYPSTALLSREIGRLLMILVSIRDRIAHGLLPASSEDRRFVIRSIDRLRDWQRAEDPRSDGVFNHPMSEDEKTRVRQMAQESLGQVLFVVQAYVGTEFFKNGSAKKAIAPEKSSEDEEGKKVKRGRTKASKPVVKEPNENEEEDLKEASDRKDMSYVSPEQRKQTWDVLAAWGLSTAVKTSKLSNEDLRDLVEIDSVDDWDLRNDHATDHPLTSYPQSRVNDRAAKAEPRVLTTGPRRLENLLPQDQTGSALSLVEVTALEVESPGDRHTGSISRAELIQLARKAESNRAEAEHFLNSYVLFIRQNELGSRVTVELLIQQMVKTPALFAKAFNSDVGAFGEAILTQEQVETMHQHLKPPAGETHIHVDKAKEVRGR